MKTFLLTAVAALFGFSSMLSAQDVTSAFVFLPKTLKDLPKVSPVSEDSAWYVVNVPVSFEAKAPASEKLKQVWIKDIQLRIHLVFETEKGKRIYLTKDVALSDVALKQGKTAGTYGATCNVGVYLSPRSMHVLFKKGEGKDELKSDLVAVAVQGSIDGTLCKVGTRADKNVAQKSAKGGRFDGKWYVKGMKKAETSAELFAVSETPFAGTQTGNFRCKPVFGAPEVDGSVFGDTSSASSASGSTSSSAASSSASSAGADSSADSGSEDSAE